MQNVQKVVVEQEETDLKSKLTKKGKEDVVVKDEEQGIKDLLKEAGLLIEQKHHEPSHANGFRLSSRSSFKSYSENNNDSDQHFCNPNPI